MAIGLTAISLLLLAAGPLGWRAGWWQFRLAFSTLMPDSAYLAIVAFVVSAVTLLFLRSSVGRRGIVLASGALIVSALLVYIPWEWQQIGATAAPIHDLSTDTENPPAFSAVLPARKAEEGNSVVYGGADIAQRQKSAYPDLAPAMTALPPPEAFRRALDTAKSMSGWTIVASDPTSGIIEASQSSFWFGFTDDIVIRVAADGPGSRVDMRSESRQGRSDFGVNAARIRAYMAALKRVLG